ncbi:hypothetical protein AVEN_147798-1 [Araneus ventricosus]|uniref:Uncharacterized protein n=1 Tax=Araneus ventricosus TaxID=182803 RepID=A0A4Y2RKB3_ARAVE|nr:hypothetical protein AVEN_147798-1 [Araneus ventricosus]
MNRFIASKAVTDFSQKVKHCLAEIGKLSPSPQTESIITPKPLCSSYDERIAKSGPMEKIVEISLLDEFSLYLQKPLLPRWSDLSIFGIRIKFVCQVCHL